MIQRPFNGNNNGGGEFIPHHENSYKRNNSITQVSTTMTSNGQRATRSGIPMSRGATHIYYKTRMCQQFIDGRCPKAADCCNYAHGPNDLRQPVINWQENGNNNKGGRNGSGNWNEDYKRPPQSGICWKFSRGEECPYGESCSYSHDATQLSVGAVMDSGQTRESSLINIKTVFDHGQSQAQATGAQVSTMSTHPDVLRTSNTLKNNYFKTRICSKWETTGHCVFADKCNYAHGPAELNKPVGLIEGDSSVAANGVHIPITEPLLTHSAAAAPLHIGSGLLNLAKRKVKGIYGDWLDDEYEE